MIIQLVTRTFINQKEATAFENFFCIKWKDLIKEIPNCKLRLIRNKNNLNTFNALWEFPDSKTQNRVMKLIKIHNKNFKGSIAKKTVNFSGEVIKEYFFEKS
tara:strand:+ start:2941 stop:3246 length:306 start_codon:yes stop_codon:yes gene_type:complete